MASSDKSSAMKWAAIGIAVVVLVGAGFFLPVQDWAAAFRNWLESLGWFGWLAYMVIYAIGTLCLVPGSLLTLAGGLAFGLWAFPLVIIGATAGAAMAFLAGRYLVRERVDKAIENYPKFKAVNSAIEEEGWKVVGLLRLSPVVPFSAQNWILGATPVGFWAYLAATAIGIMPGALLYVWIGSLGGSAAAGEGTSMAKYIFFGAGIIATLAVTILVGRKAKAKLEEHGLDESA